MVPFVFECYGSMGQCGKKLLEQLVAASAPDVQSKAQLLFVLLQRLSCVLQRGNARTSKQGMGLTHRIIANRRLLRSADTTHDNSYSRHNSVSGTVQNSSMHAVAAASQSEDEWWDEQRMQVADAAAVSELHSPQQQLSRASTPVYMSPDSPQRAFSPAA